MIGFVHKGHLILHWTIPTSHSPYIGPEQDFILQGAIIEHCELNINKCSLEQFSNALKEKKIEIPFDKQYRDHTPEGIANINKILIAMGYHTSSLSPLYFSDTLLYDKFFRSSVYKRDKNVFPVICTDLLDMICRNSQHLIGRSEKRLKSLAESASDTILKITNGNPIISRAEIDNSRQIAKKIREYLLKDDNIDEISIDTDILLIIEKDKSIIKTIKEIKIIIRKMFNGKRVIDIPTFHTLINKLLSYFAIKPIIINESINRPFSHYIAISRGGEYDKPIDIGDLMIPLSGEGLDILDEEQLKSLLDNLNNLFLVEESHDSILESIRSEATRLYYSKINNISK